LASFFQKLKFIFVVAEMNIQCVFDYFIDTEMLQKFPARGSLLVLALIVHLYKGFTHNSKNMTLPSNFRHQSQVANIFARTTLEKGVPAFNLLMTASKNNPTLTLCYGFCN
jgi:hypothetical protein